MGHISQERLNEIALRRLRNVGLAAAPGASGVLEGSVSLPGVRHPTTGAAIGAARFAVVSHDQLRYLDPPLQALPPVAFYDLISVQQLEERTTAALERRLLAVRAAAEPLKRLRISHAIDGELLAATATVATPTARFLLVAGPDGVRVGRVRLPSGQEVAIAADAPVLALADHDASIDFELALTALLPQLLARPASPSQPSAGAASASAGGAAAAPRAPAPLEPMALPGAPPLSFLLEKFGALAVSAAEIALDVRDPHDAGVAFRLLAKHTEGAVFGVRLHRKSDGAVVFEDNVDFTRVPRALDLVNTVLGRAVAQPADDAPSASSAAANTEEHGVPEHLVPHAGEVWVMAVLVEREDDAETRYVTVDADGRPYGAARILRRDVFHSVFTEHGAAWRLRIHIDEVRGASVAYRQLGADGQMSAEARTMAVSHLVASFVPEAAMY